MTQREIMEVIYRKLHDSDIEVKIVSPTEKVVQCLPR